MAIKPMALSAPDELTHRWPEWAAGEALSRRVAAHGELAPPHAAGNYIRSAADEEAEEEDRRIRELEQLVLSEAQRRISSWPQVLPKQQPVSPPTKDTPAVVLPETLLRAQCSGWDPPAGFRPPDSVWERHGVRMPRRAATGSSGATAKPKSETKLQGGARSEARDPELEHIMRQVWLPNWQSRRQ
eukprot:Hpha_TRINITY_DN13893_c0_g1::TRINITY_DN13893_c0_g1_i3::g.69898::m.69898